MIDGRWKLVIGALLLIGVLVPLGWPMAEAFTDVDAWRRLISEAPTLGRLLLNTSLIAGGAILLSLPISVCMAIGMVRLSIVTTYPLLVLFVGILFTPLALQSTAWTSFLGPYGFIDPRSWGIESVRGRVTGMLAVIGIHGVVALPWVTGMIASVLLTRSAAAEEASLVEAPLHRVLLRITSRVIRPAIPIAVGLGIIPVLTDMTACDLFGIRTFPEEVYTQFEVAGNDHSFIIGVWILSLSGAGLLAILSGPILHMKNAGGPAKLHAVGVNSSLTASLFLFASLVLLAILMAPLVALIRRLGLRSTVEPNGVEWSAEVARDYLVQFIFTDALTFLADGATAAFAALLAATIAFLFAWTWSFTSRGCQFIGVWLAAWMLLTPGPVLGIVLLQIFVRDDPVGFFAAIYDTRVIIMIGQCLRVAPLVFLFQIATLSRGTRSPWEQYRVEGASTFQVFRLAMSTRYRSLFGISFLAAFGWCLAESATTKIVAPPGIEPMSVRLFSLMHVGTGNDQAAMSLIWLASVYLVAGPLLILIRPNSKKESQRRRKTA